MDHLPNNWTRAEEPEHTPDKYHPPQTARYERSEHDIGIQAMMTDPTTEPDQEDVWRVMVSWNPPAQQAQTTPLGRVQGRDAALDLTREFMERYEARCVEEDADVMTVIENISAE